MLEFGISSLFFKGEGIVLASKNQPIKTTARRLDREMISGFLFVSPFVFGFLFFMMIPMLISLWYSFSEYNILTPAKWIGLDNYIKLFSDETFLQSLKVTLLYTFVSVPLKLCFALIVALIMTKNTRMNSVYRAVYYIPSLLGGSVAVAVLWKRVFATNGLINKTFGLSMPWLGNKNTAIWVLILLAVWQFGSSMLIFLSALKQIPISLKEASTVDGAGENQHFFRITLPLLTPTIFFNFVMQTIGAFLMFTQCQIITNGQPMNSTLFYSVYMYKQTFEFYNAGYGAAMAWVILLIISAFTGILFATKRFWVYEGGV